MEGVAGAGGDAKAEEDSKTMIIIIVSGAVLFLVVLIVLWKCCKKKDGSLSSDLEAPKGTDAQTYSPSMQPGT